MVNILNIVITILATIGTILTVLWLYKMVIMIIGIFATRKYKHTDNKHSYAICIAARNEEKVIVNILESVINQDYPLDKLMVFICANNCTDNTYQKALDYASKHPELKIVVYERIKPDERTKGYALRYLFDKIKEDYGIECVDGYMIFDADNVLRKDYIDKMNDAFDSGLKVVTSFRNSKNAAENWISFSYAVHWMDTCLTENKGKSITHLSCRIQGTGFLFANELVKDGWDYVTLTEDRSFCSDAVIKGYEIGYCDKAIFFDEQPVGLKIVLRQRLRWAKGHLQSTVENEPKLIKDMLHFNRNFFRSYDCFWLNFPADIESVIRKILTFICKLCIAFIVGQHIGSFFLGIIVTYLTSLATFWAGNMFVCLFVVIYYHKRLPKMNFIDLLFDIAMYPFFHIIGKWCMYIALFKHVEWKEIPHQSVVDVNDLR